MEQNLSSSEFWHSSRTQSDTAKNLAEVKIYRGIFQGNALSPLLFVIVMMPLDHIDRKCTEGCKLHKSQEKINHLMYVDKIRLCKKWKRIGNSNTISENIQSGYRDRIWHRKTGHANNEKRKKANDRRNGNTKARENQNAKKKGNLQELENIESRHHQTSEHERKKF